MKTENKKTFKELEVLEEIKSYIENKQYRHVKYCHYSTIKNIDSIFSSSAFLFGNMSKLNDLQDRCGGNNLYSLCFSGTYSENIPLWYLYSGINGRGGRLSFDKTAFNNWLEVTDNKIKIQPRLYKYVNNKYVETNDFSLETKDYELLASDVIYISTEKGKLRMKYNSEVKNDFNEDCEKLKDAFKYFNKYISWFYEKEFRIVIIVKNEELNKKLNETIENKIFLYRLGFSIDRVISQIELTLAPEFDEKEKDNVIIMEGIKNYLKQKVNSSVLAGQIEMNLLTKFCDSCEEKCISKDCIQREKQKR